MQNNYAVLKWVAEQTGLLAGISEVVLAGGGVTDAGASLLPKFTGLKRLDLSGARVSVGLRWKGSGASSSTRIARSSPNWPRSTSGA